MSSTTIVGGGVIGLSIAYELAKRGRQVTLLEKERPGRATSWAAAGILLPANRLTANHPLEHLSALSNRLHSEWADELKTATGIDNGIHQCGGLYVARTRGEQATLYGLKTQWEQEKIEFEFFDSKSVQSIPPAQASPDSFADIRAAIHVFDESQICNPHHIEALIAACKKLDVQIEERQGVTQIVESNQSIQAIRTKAKEFTSDHYVFTGGVWTREILSKVYDLPMLPVRGQMVMYKLPKPIFAPIVYEGSHYLVPRRDGHVLAGATVEERGFDNSTTNEAIGMLMKFAQRQFPQLNASTKVKQWAGLRPTTYDGFPYIGKLPKLTNGYAAAGHFRLGIQLSTGTSVAICDLLEGKDPSIDLAPFNLARVSS